MFVLFLCLPAKISQGVGFFQCDLEVLVSCDTQKCDHSCLELALAVGRSRELACSKRGEDSLSSHLCGLLCSTCKAASLWSAFPDPLVCEFPTSSGSQAAAGAMLGSPGFTGKLARVMGRYQTKAQKNFGAFPLCLSCNILISAATSKGGLCTRQELCATWLDAFQGLVPPYLPEVPQNEVVSCDTSRNTSRESRM